MGSPREIARRASTSRFAEMALQCLYHHRLLSTGQLRRLLLPHAGPRYAQRELGRLCSDGLIASTSTRRPRELAWYVTAVGAQLVEAGGDVPPRAYRMDPARAAGPLQEHTLAVNETGIAFVEHARRLGHECGPLDWTPEVAHPIAATGRYTDSHVISDAVLDYIADDAHRRLQARFFLEIDRATMPVSRLAARIVGYARYHDYTPTTGSADAPMPAWRYRYPRFPRLIIVLTGKDRPALDRRRRDLAAHVAALPYLHRHRDGFAAYATTREQLHEAGPTGAVFSPLVQAVGHAVPLITTSA